MTTSLRSVTKKFNDYLRTWNFKLRYVGMENPLTATYMPDNHKKRIKEGGIN